MMPCAADKRAQQQEKQAGFHGNSFDDERDPTAPVGVVIAR
ncbi:MULTISPECIES: hypothetical protein [unclassified Symbiopectobacterium]|nr:MULTISPECIES: hypothetical protein [unclassified Symbiopectobacterium]